MTADALFADPRFLTELERILRARVRRRFPALIDHLDDLVSQATGDLWRFAARNARIIANLDLKSELPLAGDSGELLRVARTIVDRRAADLCRSGAARWANESLSSEDAVQQPDSLDSDAASLPRQLLLRQMLRVCISELALASPEERDALWAVVGDSGEGGVAQSDAQRQRLSRLRKRLAHAITQRLGESAASLLAADLRDD